MLESRTRRLFALHRRGKPKDKAMCGIVGYVGERSCQELLLHGLERLEYRGYDSAGLSLVNGGTIESVRSVGNLSRLREAVVAANGNGSHDGAVVADVLEATT